MRCTYPSVGLLLTNLPLDLREAEVTELDVPVLINQDVGTFQIAVQNLSSVQVVHAERNILNNLHESLLVKTRFFLMQMVEQASLFQESIE